MSNLFFVFFSLALTAAAEAGPGPIRVLYLGKEGTTAPKHCHVTHTKKSFYNPRFL